MRVKMAQRMRAKLTPEIHGRARERGLSAHQLLTLASIIEREAIVKDEQRLISAVFWNRLKIGMPLQADPTVQYAAAKERRALSRADLVIDHPYNTYVHAGLPPGPIASPGLEAIHAALDPAPVKYLYFVARDDHRHHFSTTVDEHNAAVADHLPGDAARVARDAAAPGVPPAHRLDPPQPRPRRRRRAAPGARRARARARRRHLPRGAVQRQRPARARPAGSGAARAALGRAGGAGGHPRHVGGPARPALLRAARDAAGRALRPAAALLAEPCLRPRDPARRARP